MLTAAVAEAAVTRWWTAERSTEVAAAGRSLHSCVSYHQQPQKQSCWSAKSSPENESGRSLWPASAQWPVDRTGSFRALAPPPRHTHGHHHATYFFLVMYAFTLFCFLVTLRASEGAAQCIVIGPVCLFVCLCVCFHNKSNCVHRSSPNWVCRWR